MVKISPSILSCDFSNLAHQIKIVEEEGVDILHLDIMDGHFVPNLSFGPQVLSSLRSKTKLLFNAHLMIENPDEFILPFSEAGADIICVHVEACKDLRMTINKIKSLGKKVGVSLNPDTPLKEVVPFLYELDIVTLMTVFPGFGEQEFIYSSLEKIKNLKKIIEDKKINLDIEVDGGINLKTAPKAVSSGADILVVGSAIYHAKNPGKVIKFLKSL